jgi:hypothetical protein
MPNGPDDARADTERHLSERERAVRAALLGLALGVFLRLVSRGRTV